MQMNLWLFLAWSICHPEHMVHKGFSNCLLWLKTGLWEF